jgi:hypothetical protein
MDTAHALNIFSCSTLDPHKTCHLFLLDVCSLYTYIPHAEGIKTLKLFLNQRQNPSISNDTLVRLTELVLNLNTFEFNGNSFEQVSGVAVGTKMGPSYACLLMGYLEIHTLEEYSKKLMGSFPLQYLRHTDDGISLSNTLLGDINRLLNYVGYFNLCTQFTSCISFVSVNFLDMSVRLSPGCSLSPIF